MIANQSELILQLVSEKAEIRQSYIQLPKR